jgi:Flp pilus assembly protein TadD
MSANSIRSLFLLPVLGLAMAGAAMAAPSETAPVQNAQVNDFIAGKKAIDARNWELAVSSFDKVVAQDPKNADAYNYLGFSNRWLGRYDAAFAAYDKALALDPNHKGALNYSGIAYLKTDQKAKAEVQLTKLQASCSTCDETKLLAKAIADYKPAAK